MFFLFRFFVKRRTGMQAHVIAAAAADTATATAATATTKKMPLRDARGYEIELQVHVILLH